MLVKQTLCAWLQAFPTVQLIISITGYDGPVTKTM